MAIGLFLGVEAFNNIRTDDRIMEIRRKLAAAQRKDNAAKKREEYASEQLLELLSEKEVGAGAQPRATGLFKATVQEYMDEFRADYANIVIRRTVNSKDYRGMPISGLPAYHEQVVMCVLTDAEHETFRQVVETLADKEGAKGIRGQVGVHLADGAQCTADKPGIRQHFYLAQRRCLTHPSVLGPSHGWNVPATGAEFDQHPTAKLYVLRRLLQHHLHGDKARPLRNARGLETDRSKYPPWPESNRLVEVDDFRYTEYKDGPPDKIIVYSAFPSNNDVILKVGHSPLRLSGTVAKGLVAS